MLSDKYCRLHCDIGVAYGSDTQVVHDVLLNIALQHEEVIKIGRNKPTVLFVSFGDSSLVFQLSCLIKDVNKKSVVQSELNYAIEKAFREHQIEMPYPQREIHLKLAELTAISTKISEE
jgi:small-conductance mechanosensitive channel